MFAAKLLGLAAGAALALSLNLGRRRAEVSEVRISKGYGALYLPLFVMQEKKFLGPRPPRPASATSR